MNNYLKIWKTTLSPTRHNQETVCDTNKKYHDINISWKTIIFLKLAQQVNYLVEERLKLYLQSITKLLSNKNTAICKIIENYENEKRKLNKAWALSL